MGEKFASNPVTGSGSMSIPIATSPGRSGFGPQLSLAYDSGAGNGPFGFGWSLSLPSISRKTDKGLPRYDDGAASDVFLLSGAEDLVPMLVENARGYWEPEQLAERTVNASRYRIDRYRPRVEGLFARIERWTNTIDDTDVFWRSITKDNITTWYGRSADSRIADPEEPRRIFRWLICQSHDDKGNAVAYGYKAEDSARVLADGVGVTPAKAHERNRTGRTRSAQRYLKRIRYGNRSPYFPALREDAPWPEPLDAHGDDGSDSWHFEAVFDYGEHGVEAPTPNGPDAWPCRNDPFSSYRAGFEIRTYRICQRVLMFHHFPEEPAVGRNCLVRSTDFQYSDEVNPADVRNPVYTFLRSATQSGYRREDGVFAQRSLPPVEFEYAEPIVQDLVEQVNPLSAENLPIGLDGNVYRWTDLHGEGVPGILTEQAGTWFYKRNLSPVPETLPDGRELISAKFAALENVALKPNAALDQGAEFMDLAGDGQPDVVVMDGEIAGLFEHDEAEGWKPFRPFASLLNRDLRDPNLKFVDLDGDGHADALISEEEAFIWYPSLAEGGFGPARRVAQALDEEKGPRVVFADGTQSIHLADISGDGLTDIVRIRNGDVCYWPNLGYGRFGAKITMDHAPWFDHPDQFDHSRIRLADIDGSGTTDILYLHRDGVRLYFNQSGNSWSQSHSLRAFPRIDDVVNVVATDLLGNGTACLVWSSSLPGDGRRPMSYVKLMGDRKPHLLVRTANNLGAETRVEYAPSTKFYLRDKLAGKPWVTRLPFPVHVVERVTTFDHIGRNRFVTEYAYHHGHFDGVEREFRGFGMVEQWDTTHLANPANTGGPVDNQALPYHVPPLHTKTWFHTGAHSSEDRISRHFEDEYFREPGLDRLGAQRLLLDDTVLPGGLSAEEEREAARALKGGMLRQEVYADDVTPDATAGQKERTATPYTVIEQNAAIRLLQPRASNCHAVFFPRPNEVISHTYERDARDPRVQHEIILEVDDYGNVLKKCSIGYGRRTEHRIRDAAGNPQQIPNPGLLNLPPADRARQTTPLLVYWENRFTNACETPDAHRVPAAAETLSFELTNYIPTGANGRYVAADFVEPDPLRPGSFRHRFNLPEVEHEASADGGRRRRLIECVRSLYRRDDLEDLLPLGQLESGALPGETYRLAYTSGLIDQVFKRPRPGEADEALLPEPARVALLGDEGGYVASQTLKAAGRFPGSDPDDHWWIPSGRSFYSPDPADPAGVELGNARRHFYLHRRYLDPFGHGSAVDFDRYDLLLLEIRDPLNNRVAVNANDYRVLQPSAVSDANGNRSEVAFDTLGMPSGTAVMGKPGSAEGDTLDGFLADATPEQLAGFFDSPRRRTGSGESEAAPITLELLQGATTRVIYDLDRFRRSGQPPVAATIARETHVSDLAGGQQSKLQVSFSYSDGFGREIQKKIQAEAGPLDVDDAGAPSVSPRWLGSGWMLFNNKGKPVRQFEPFFSDTHEFQSGAVRGVSTTLFYDPAGRLIATLHPNGTYEKVVWDAWRQTVYDVNDTCAARNRETGDPRNDPDIGGYVAAYFQTQRADWTTWHATRIGGSDPHERRSAERAAEHADTPTTMHFDVLGRPFMTVTRNRVACPGHELDGTEEAIATRADLDIEGNQRTVRDERKLPVDYLPVGATEQRVVMRYCYDMLGNRIHQASMEAGSRWMLNDVAGKPIRVWDSRGHTFTTTYDPLRRPVEQLVRGTTADSDPRTVNRDILVEKIEYGESVSGAEPANLRTRIFRQWDSAGMVTNARLDAAGRPVEAYDFKGNLLCSTRRLASDYKQIPDWNDDPALDEEMFEASTRYDAINRPIQSIAPHSNRPGASWNVVQSSFNEAGLLENVDVWLERGAGPAGLLDRATEAPSPAGVRGIEYNAKGQRLRIDYRNGATTSYGYDPLTFRLRRLITQRDAGSFPSDAPHPEVPAWPGRHVQNLSYTYDPAGNITHIQDDAQQTIFFRNQRIEPSNDYVYDALYRLIRAEGREHLGQAGEPIAHSSGDAGRVGIPSASPSGRFAPNDASAMGTYAEQYVYDAVGNFLQMRHNRTDAAVPGWTRRYTYSEASALEVDKQSNRLSRTAVSGGVTPEDYAYDVHGNMLRMPHLGDGVPGPNMHWDYRDKLRQVDLGGGGTAHYVYGAAGQRMRKVWEKSPGLVEERIYLGGFEVFRQYRGAIGAVSATLERETLQIMDDRQRIAVVETRTRDLAGTDRAPRQSIRYQFGNHLGSASLELDDLAEIVSYEEFAPYGSSTYQAVRSATECPKRYRFTGMERDEESGLGYHGARYYAPWLGRWAAGDRTLRDGLNLYGYVRNNPLRYHDPTGLNAATKLTSEQTKMLDAVSEKYRAAYEEANGKFSFEKYGKNAIFRRGQYAESKVQPFLRKLDPKVQFSPATPILEDGEVIGFKADFYSPKANLQGELTYSEAGVSRIPRKALQQAAQWETAAKEGRAFAQVFAKDPWIALTPSQVQELVANGGWRAGLANNERTMQDVSIADISLPNVPPELPDMSMMPNVPPELPDMSTMPNVPPELPDMSMMPNVPPELPDMSMMPNIPPEISDFQQPFLKNALPVVPLPLGSMPSIPAAAPPTMVPASPSAVGPWVPAVLGVGILLLLIGIEPKGERPGRPDYGGTA